ncbi:hypothetical protein BASA81_007583 [Batrachochytrium salamandrivorans]|nr:hypothetical protein BASA81_007583 [Batrachochytrium salamandrivorans]
MKSNLMIALLLIIANAVCAHGIHPEGEVEFAHRALYRTQDTHLVIVAQPNNDESDLAIIGALTCDESELPLADAESLSLGELLPAPVVNSDPVGFGFHSHHDDVYVFTVDFASPTFPCWMVLHSDAVTVTIMDSNTGTRLAPEFTVEMELELPSRSTDVDGQAAAAVLIVCILPLLLVLVFVGCASSVPAMVDYGVVALFFQSFGCGALLSVVFLHMYPEVIEGLEHSNQEQWRGAALVLGAIAVMILVQLIVGTFFAHDHHAMNVRNSATPVEVVAPDVEKHEHGHSHAAASTSALTTLEYGTMRGIFDFKSLPVVVWGLTLGDAIHNLVDGAAMTTAFLACGTGSGWIITAGIVAHEIPQELADLVMMTSQGATLKQACFFNLLAQCSALIGMGIVMSLGSLDEGSQALLMAFGLGTFLYIALCNIMPKIVTARTKGQILAVACGLTLSCTLIGLTTMLQEGC